jgi:hypothetical protein
MGGYSLAAKAFEVVFRQGLPTLVISNGEEVRVLVSHDLIV